MLLLGFTKAKTLLSTGYGDFLGPRELLYSYWEQMAEKLEITPPQSRWGTTIPYCLWGDEGTLKNSASWMFGTVCPVVTKLFWEARTL